MTAGLEGRFVANSMMEMKHADLKKIVQHMKVCKSLSLGKESYFSQFHNKISNIYILSFYIYQTVINLAPLTGTQCVDQMVRLIVIFVFSTMHSAATPL